MALDPRKYRAALANLGPETPAFAARAKDFRAWLEDKNVPDDVADFMLDNALTVHLPFPDGFGGIWTFRDMMALNDQEFAIFGAGLLSLGSATSGDVIVIDLRDKERRAGFVSEEALARCPVLDARTIFAPIATSIDEMLEGISSALREHVRRGEKRRYPISYWDAVSFGETE